MPELSVADEAFAASWTIADSVPGWLTRDQAHALWQAVTRLGAGATVVEIGSHQGRSTVVLAGAARQVGARVVAVDPFVEGRLFGGRATRSRFERTIESAGVSDVVELVPDYSTRLRPGWSRSVDLVYVDGKHDYWTCRDDMRWAEFLPAGGEIFVHDAFSSVGVTGAVAAHVLLGGRLRYRDRVASLARFDTCRATLGDRVAVARQLGWFARNVVVKVLLRLRLRAATRLLGHRGPYDPY
ncbi:MAG: class I SAM-dependent methyltransferase [Actinomycetes bacterium]